MMDFALEFFSKGGPWMYLILLFAVLGLPLSLVAGVLHGMGKRIPSFLWVAPLAAVASAGALGTWHGQSLATAAVAAVSASDKAAAMANGISISLYTTVFAAFALIVLGPAMAFAVSLGHIVSVRGERGRWSLGAGIGSIALVGLGTLVTAFLTAMSLLAGQEGPLVVAGLFVGMVAVVCAGLAGLRCGADEAGRERSAGARFTVWASLSLAAWGAMALPRISGEVMVFKAVAAVAASDKAEMLAYGMEVASGSGRVGLGALVGALAMGLALLLPLAGAAARTPGKLGLNSLLVVGTLGLLLLSAGSHWQSKLWIEELNSAGPGPEPTSEHLDLSDHFSEVAKAKEEEGKKVHRLKRAKGSKVEIQQRQLDREIAESTGLLADLKQMSDSSAFGTGEGESSAVGGLIGSQYGQIGAGGLGSRGSGLGGGGSAAGLGGLGSRGSGEGASGYGRGAGFYGKKGGGAPGVGTGDPIILGALDKSIIDRVVKQHLAKLRYCYQKELNKNPKLSGKLVVKFVVAQDGSVSTAITKVSTLGNPIVEKCVNARFMRMRFPAPKGGGIVIVSYPFVFNPQS